MCGIAGVVSFDGREIPCSLLRRMADALRHRGPDDEGLWHSAADGISVGLVHRRLSVVDPTPAGHQPMTSEDQSVWLTFNGEIYDHRDTRRVLERAGHRYASQTDSETILHGYEEWGEDVVRHLRGMFAFAVWDAPRRRLVLARDHLGVKPLYYARVGGTLVFASEIKALLASGLVAAEHEPAALPEYLLFGYLTGDRTMFRGISILPPGHSLLFDDRGVRVRQYWDVTFAPAADDGSDLSAEFRQRFETAVRLNTMSDVPLGVFLSGGLDSSAIAAVLRDQSAEPLRTFSVGFPAGEYSELGFARAVAAHLGTEHHEVVLTAADFLNTLPRAVHHEDEPLWTIASVATYQLAHLASRHVKVVLTGEGSDELFAGYDRYWCGRLNEKAAGVYQRVPARVRRLIGAALTRSPLPERLRRALSHTVLCRETTPESLVFDNWFGVFTPAMQRELWHDGSPLPVDDRDLYAGHLSHFDAAHGGDIVGRMLTVDVKTNLVELLMKQDRMSMAASLEARVPFLDHELVEFAARVPPAANLRGFGGKQLLKDAVRDRLPASIVDRRKQGFPVPFDRWLQRDFALPVRRLLLSEAALSRGWFRPERVGELLDAHAAARAYFARQIWALLSLELWARIFLDGDRLWIEDPAEAWSAVERAPSPARRLHQPLEHEHARVTRTRAYESGR
jgi:asparagine synthase (glutamine-hydrolysing)